MLLESLISVSKLATVRNLFSSVSNSVMDTLAMTDISARSMASFAESIELMRAVGELREKEGDTGENGEARAKRLDRMRRALPVALAQKERGFPFLHGLSAVAVWSELEAYVEDLAVELLLLDKGLAQAEPFSRLKAPVIEFVNLSERERAEWLIRSVQKDTGAGQRNAISSLQCPAGAVGLNGPISDDVKMPLIELNAVRNLLVHRRGVVDARFLTLCPWSELTIGNTVRVSRVMLEGYSAAVILFAAELVVQALSKYGEEADSLEKTVITTSRSMLAHSTSINRGLSPGSAENA